MNLNVEVAQLRALLQRIADHHAQDAAWPRVCAAGCPGGWPCSTRQLVDWGEVHPVDHPLTVASYPTAPPFAPPQAPNEDGHSAPPIAPQRPEQAELVHGPTPEASEAPEGEWRRIPHWDTYAVTNAGRIRSVATGKELQPRADGTVRLVRMWGRGRATRHVDALVSLAFPEGVGGAGASW